jgi:hypothetical protein
MPPDITAMLEKTGVRLSTLKEVEVGYDSRPPGLPCPTATVSRSSTCT